MKQAMSTLYTVFAVQPWLENSVNKVKKNDNSYSSRFFELALILIHQIFFHCYCIKQKIMLLLSEYGFVDYHERNAIRRHTDFAVREVLIEREDKYEGPRVLSLEPLSMCFSFLILGLLISTIVFVFEVLSFTGPQKSVLQG